MLLLTFGLAGCLLDKEAYLSRRAALTDHDGDGVIQEDDCDDADDAVYPGAAEVCDGADNDCDGDVDDAASDATAWHPDVDADGFGDAAAEPMIACSAPAGSVANALDCDDTRTGVSPGATEVAYDGLDNDCVDGDLRDADADGFDAEQVGGDDCDDTAAGVNPAAPEASYDGVDNDCAGGDLTDADGDGADALVAGGDDCDDNDGAVFPGATEPWSDGLTDNDCDLATTGGEISISTGPWGGFTALAGQASRLVVVGDATGDGYFEFVVASPEDTTAGLDGGAAYLLGPTLLDASEVPTLTAGSGALLGASLDHADVDGDGRVELLVTGASSASSASVWAVNLESWQSAGSVDVEAVSELAAVFNGAALGEGDLGAYAVGDVDGDGIGDLAVCEALLEFRVAIIPFDAFGGTTDDVDTLISFPDFAIGGRVSNISDIDGDGIAEVYVGVRRSDDLIGVAFRADQPRAIGDAALLQLARTNRSEDEASGGAGDLDGDGVGSIFTAADRTFALLTDLSRGGTLTAEDASFTLPLPEQAAINTVVPLGDRDGDGLGELFLPFYDNGSTGSTMLLLTGAQIADNLTLDFDDITLRATSTDLDAQYGYSAALSDDVDGDGVEDIVLGAPGYSGEAERGGGAALLPVPR